MRLSFSARFCSLAAASLLTGACGGQSSVERSPAGGSSNQAGGAAGSGGQLAPSAGASGTSGGSDGLTLGAGTSGMSGGSDGLTLGAGSGGSGGCALDCSIGSQFYCGQCQISRAVADSCVVVPTYSEPVEAVMFDCASLTQGENGYEIDAQRQLVLTGDACDALKTTAPHRIEVVLGCTLDK